jgi:hypothetical protein
MQVVVEVDGGQVEELCQIQIILEEVEEVVKEANKADQEWLIEAVEVAEVDKTHHNLVMVAVEEVE